MGSHPIHVALTTEYVRKLILLQARRISRSPGFRPSQRQDIEQELATRVLEQAHLFDPARATAHTFIAQIVASTASNLRRGQCRKKRLIEHEAVSLDSRVYLERGEALTLGDIIDEEDLCRRHGGCSERGTEAPDEEIAAALASLPPRLQAIAARLADGTESSVASALGLSRRQIRKAVAALREHFESRGLGRNS